MNFRYRIYPSLEQESRMLSWLEACRGVYNYALRERKDWINSRKCAIDRCNLKQCYIRPRFFGKLQRKLNLLQRRLKRMQRDSNNRAQLIQKIGRVHEKIAASRLDWQFKLAHKLCDQAQNIFIEDIDFRVMAKGFLGKHTLDAGLEQFLNRALPWVCFKRGVYLGKVDPNGTSQTCPDCGARVRKDLSVRIHQCHECGSTKPRDIASAQVINARSLSGIENVCGWDLSGSLPTATRQDRVKQKCLEATQEACFLSLG